MPTSAAIGITDAKVIATYNWVEEDEPTIIVPGSAPLWDPPIPAPLLVPDSGVQFIDQNGYRIAKAPAEPQVRAIIRCNPDFSFSGFDILADRRPLSRILNMDSDSREFAIDVQVIGKTVVLTRKEKAFTEEIEGYNGFRHNFEQKYFKRPGFAKDVTSYRRVVSYSFGDLRVLVHCAVDGVGREAFDRVFEDGSMAQLKDQTPKESNVTLLEGGTHFPKEAAFEFATRKVDAPYTEYETRKLPDLWLAQTDAFMLGRVTFRWNDDVDRIRGRFYSKDIEWFDSKRDAEQWEKDNHAGLSLFYDRLVALLGELRDLSHGLGPEKYIVEREEGGTSLKVTWNPYGPGLPADLFHHFE